MSADTPRRIVIIDDHALLRESLALVLAEHPKFEVVGEAGDAVTARTLVAELMPEIALVDVMLGEDDGLALLRELRVLSPETRTVAMTMLEPAIYAPRAHAAGAAAFIHKSDGLSHVLRVLTRLVGTTPRPIPLAESPSEVASLTDRELHVFKLFGFGHTNREIAAALGVSPRTVDSHRDHIRAKLCFAHTRLVVVAAVQWVTRQGLGPT